MSEAPRNWPYRLLAFVLAVGLWWVIVAEKRELESEKVVEASVTYNTPKKVLLLNRASQVRVSVRGRNREIRRLRPFDVEVLVDVPEGQRGVISMTLTPDNVALPSDNLAVVAIEPRLLTLQIDTEVEREVPIEVDLTGEPAAGAIVARRVAIPDRALVAGPASQVSQLRRISTGRVSLDGHAFTFEKEVSLVTTDPHFRVVSPSTVTVQVTLEQPPAGGKN